MSYLSFVLHTLFSFQGAIPDCRFQMSDFRHLFYFLFELFQTQRLTETFLSANLQARNTCFLAIFL